MNTVTFGACAAAKMATFPSNDRAWDTLRAGEWKRENMAEPRECWTRHGQVAWLNVHTHVLLIATMSTDALRAKT